MKKILLAEDECIVALAISNGLKYLGYNVLKSVSKGQDLINEALKNKPDIIITDIHLKDKITGIDAVNKIRNSLNSIIILITGYSDPATLEEIQSVKPDGFLLKPISIPQLQQLLLKTEQESTLSYS